MISSGDSVIEIGKKLKERGAKRIFVFATFGLFVACLDVFDKAYEEGYIDRVYTTDLIYRLPELASRDWYIEVNMSKYISLIVDTLNKDQTISDLLSPADRINTFLEKREADGTITR
jgi:ribose-phosphate pyrophosphokinase